ncbi:PPR repeat [Musa troglodytarum]|uniref:PPR repeat n=1 Tax=Musa troglodytarum TaxID=320322 RepID=A0A9E7HLF2_9LILI|nr:PPR repeat [Musa troglodytarum]URE32260.1 PPR repeat [Musa troglodytarum]URE32261.1 PPR repeat [Musa troglodytarum]URE32262.1 PPR repeat [Musa troglodytarum]
MPPPHPQSMAEVARRLGRALLSASKPSHSWSPAVEQVLHRRLPAAPLTASLVAAVIDPHLLHHHDLAAGLFHWAAQQPNFSHIPETYHSLLKSLSLSRHPHLIQSLLKTAKSHRVSLPFSSYQLAISSLLLSGKSIEAARLIDPAPENGVEEFPSSLYNSLLAALSSDGFLDVARKVFDRMLTRGIMLNDVGFGVFIGKVCDSEGLDGVLGVLDGIKKLDCQFNGSVIAALVVNRLCRAGRIEDAWCALEQLRNRCCKPDFIAYRLVSEGYKLAGRVEEAGRILKQKRKFGVAPRAKDYREFILSSISDKRIQEAKELGEAIVDGQFPIDDDVLDGLIGSVSAVEPDSAILFFKCMIGKDRFPSLSMLSKLSRNLCRNEKSNAMWDVYRVLMDKGYFNGVEQYNVMVSFLCKAGRVREAYEVLREMRKRGFGPNIYSYNCLMEACCREDLLRPAKKLWDEMFANGCGADLHTYNILIRKFSEKGEAEEARQLYCRMLDKGVIPDSVTYTSLVKVLYREEKIEEAIQIFKKSMDQDVALGSSILSLLVLFLCKDGKYMAASSLMQSSPSEVASSDSHVILLKGLTDAGLIEMAVKHIDWLKTDSHVKFQTVLTELMASLSTAPNLEPVTQLLRAMHARGFVSDDGPWKSLL